MSECTCATCPVHAKARDESRLTETQRATLQYMRLYQAQFRRPATIREIAARFDIGSTAACDRLVQLRGHGYVRHTPGTARGWMAL